MTAALTPPRRGPSSATAALMSLGRGAARARCGPRARRRGLHHLAADRRRGRSRRACSWSSSATAAPTSAAARPSVCLHHIAADRRRGRSPPRSSSPACSVLLVELGDRRADVGAHLELGAAAPCRRRSPPPRPSSPASCTSPQPAADRRPPPRALGHRGLSPLASCPPRVLPSPRSPLHGRTAAELELQVTIDYAAGSARTSSSARSAPR